MAKKAVVETAPKARFKKGDQVRVIAGKAKGQTGELLKVDTRRQVVLIKGVNMRQKHAKPKRQGEKGSIMSVEGPIHASKVLAHCPTCDRGVRKLCTDSKACRYNKS